MKAEISAGQLYNRKLRQLYNRKLRWLIDDRELQDTHHGLITTNASTPATTFKKQGGELKRKKGMKIDFTLT